MRYPSRPQPVVRPTAPGVGPFVVEQATAAPWVGYLVDQSGHRALYFNVAPGQATGCSPSQVRKRTEWLLAAVNEHWNKQQAMESMARSFSGEKP